MKNKLQGIIVSLLILVTTNVLGETTSVMSFNLRYDNPKDEKNRWEKRREAVVNLIEYYHPDIFGIQEGLYHQVQYLDNSLANYKYIGMGRDDGKTKGEFSAIFYNTTKFSVKNHATFWLSENPGKVSVGWDASMERISSYGLFKHIATGKKIWLFNTHYDHKGVIAREMSSNLIIAKIKDLNREGLPVVLTGDFNSVPESKAIQIILSELDDSFVSALKTRYGPVGTFNGFEASKILDYRIDYIFTQNISVVSHVHIDDKRPDGNFISDHLPVLSTFTF